MRKPPIRVAFPIGREGIRTDFNATARWAVAATSSKTGGFLTFRQRRKGNRIPHPFLDQLRSKDFGSSCESRPYGRFFYWQRRDSNQFPCNSPVGCCGHQFKNWWLPYFSPSAKRQSKPSSNPPSRQRNWNLWGCPKPPLCKGRWQKSIDFCRRGCPDKCQSPSQLR